MEFYYHSCGYLGVRVFRDNRFGVSDGPIFVNRLACTGTETNILQCVSRIGFHSCSHDNDIAIECTGT